MSHVSREPCNMYEITICNKSGFFLQFDLKDFLSRTAEFTSLALVPLPITEDVKNANLIATPDVWLGFVGDSGLEPLQNFRHFAVAKDIG